LPLTLTSSTPFRLGLGVGQRVLLGEAQWAASDHLAPPAQLAAAGVFSGRQRDLYLSHADHVKAAGKSVG